MEKGSKMKPIGQTITLHFISGRPDGLRTGEMPNWSGHVLVVPRTEEDALKSRVELKRSGIYIMIGEVDGRSAAYIGEADDLSDRMGTYRSAREKLWRDNTVFVTDVGNRLHKTAVQYLESRLVDLLKSARRVEKVANGNTPKLPNISPYERDAMESFLADLLVVLPALKIEVFERLVRDIEIKKSPTSTEVRFVRESKKLKGKATAVIRDGEFIVEAGSVGSEWRSAATHHVYAGMSQRLISEGVIQKRDDGGLVFTKNYKFSSPSAAAATIIGRPANGFTEWKREGTQQTFADWEASQQSDT